MGATAVRSRIRRSKPDLIFDIINYALLTILLLIVLYPIFFVLIASFSDPNLSNSGQVWLYPKGFNYDAYKTLLGERKIWIGYRNTVFYATLGTMISLCVTLPCAYSMSTKRFKIRNFLMVVFVIPMFFSGGLIPFYIVIMKLGMMNTIWSQLLPGAFAVYNMILARIFFISTIPGELEDAAFIDGCKNFGLFTRIVLPLSKPIIATIALFSVVGFWNSYFYSLIFLRDENLFPLQLLLRDILIINQNITGGLLTDPETQAMKMRTYELLKYTVVIAASLPLLVVYPFLQKYFVKGIMLGSLKG